MLVALGVVIAVIGGQSVGAVLGGLSIGAWLSLATFIVSLEPEVAALISAGHPILAALVDDVVNKRIAVQTAAQKAQDAARVNPLGMG